MATKESESPLSAQHVRHVMNLSQAGPTKRIESDAVEAVQACSSEFLSFIASEARVKVRREGRSEVNEGDMLWALHALGFKSFADALRGHLHQQYTVRGAGGQPKAPPGAPGVKPAKRPRVAGGPGTGVPRGESFFCGQCRACLDKPQFGGPGRLKQGCMMRDPNAKISRASPGNPNPGHAHAHAHAHAAPLGAMPVSGSPGAPPFAFPPCRSGGATSAAMPPPPPQPPHGAMATPPAHFAQQHAQAQMQAQMQAHQQGQMQAHMQVQMQAQMQAQQAQQAQLQAQAQMQMQAQMQGQMQAQQALQSRVRIVVPPGVGPGQPFGVTVNGQMLTVKCPPGVQPGQQIQVQVPAALAAQAQQPLSQLPPQQQLLPPQQLPPQQQQLLLPPQQPPQQLPPQQPMQQQPMQQQPMQLPPQQPPNVEPQMQVPPPPGMPPAPNVSQTAGAIFDAISGGGQ